MENDMKQKAGDNSTQIQAEVVNVIQFDEKRVREICKEEYALQAKNLIFEAQVAAVERVGRFEDKIIEMFKPYRDSLEFFKKPEFLFLLRLAQQTAIQTDSDNDYEILANLLLNKTNKSDDKKFGTGVKQAIQIVDEIDEDSLNGLTALFIHTSFTPITSSPIEYFKILDNLYEECLNYPLPSGELWSDQLDILKCCRLDNVHSYIKGLDFYMSKHKYLFTSGIIKDSENYEKALEILKTNNIPNDILVNNELFDNYVRLNIADDKSIDNLRLIFNLGSYKYKSQLSNQQKNALREILKLYDSSISNDKIKESMLNYIKKFKHLNSFLDWFNELKFVVQITSVGRVLSYTNAKMKCKELPDMF